MVSIFSWASQLKREPAEENQDNLAITKLLHFRKILGCQTFGPHNISQSILYSSWIVNTWVGRVVRKEKQIPGPKTLSGLAWRGDSCPEKIVWPCQEKKPILTVSMILYFSHAPACSSAEKHHALEEENIMPPFSCTCCMNMQKETYSPLFFKQ